MTDISNDDTEQPATEPVVVPGDDVTADTAPVDTAPVDTDDPSPVEAGGPASDVMFSTPIEAVAAPRSAPKRSSQRPARRKGRVAGGGKSTKESFYVRVAQPDGTSTFFPATDYIGKPMPFSSAKETCAMRVYPEVVCFSLLHLTKRASKDLKEKTIQVPHAALARLARRSTEVPNDAGVLVVEHRLDVDGEVVDRSVTMSIKVDSAKIAVIESTDPVGEEPFELSGRGERISLFLTSPTVGRRVALGYIGHLGRPGSADTMLRCAAKIINAAAALPEFSLLTGIEAADVPSMAGGMVAVRPAATAATVDVPIALFSDSTPPTLVAEGSVQVDVDLEHANASTDRLLFRLTPDEAIAEQFEAYRATTENWVQRRMADLFGSEVQMFIYDIVLGEVTDETVKRINERLVEIGGVDVTPRQFRDRTS